MMDSPVLLIEGLEKRFGEVTVLRDVHAALTPGTVTAFVGPNGAGKTTLFHAITGDLKPDAGEVILEGRDITAQPPWRIARQGLGKMFQDVRVFENLSILDNVVLALHDHASQTVWSSLAGLWRRDQRRAERVEAAESWLALAGVQRPWNRTAGDLSFGNQKLLALARLMAGGFRLLLLDEPTSGVSPVMVNDMANIIHNLADQGVTVALIEHNYAFVKDVASACYLLRDGTVHDTGPTDEVLGKPDNREILIGL
jgi:ABC-type branched-subunit amino acid transport system ATPase component